MNRPIDTTELDALVAVARAAEPPALSPLEARRMVRSAAAHASERGSRRWMLWACAAAAALCLGVVTQRLVARSATRVEVGLSDRSLRFALRSGDALVAAPGSELSIAAQEPALRQVRVQRGTVLFDVLPLRAGERFEVETRDARLRVVGTVFTVAVEGGRTVVRVYEGRVWVEGQVVAAGRAWSSVAGQLPGDAVLEDEAREAARAREPRARPGASLPVQSAAAATSIEPRVSALHPSPLPEAPSSGQGEAELAPSLAQARRWLELGQTERALAAARAHRADGDGAWLLVEADTQHALGRFAEALAAYERAAAALADAERARAAYAAAVLAVQPLRDPARCLGILDQYALDDDRSAQRERATVLRIDALLTMGQRDAARVHALRYLSREPETGTSARMRALVSGAQGAN